MSISINEKTIFVTGANRGIGKAIVEKFLTMGAAKIYAGVRHLEKGEPLKEQYGDRLQLVQLDVSDRDRIATIPAIAPDVEIVVNSAGILNAIPTLENEALEKLEEQMNVNVYGLLALGQAFAPVLKENGGGAFVQLNSVASFRAGSDFGMYAASKAASYAITQSLSYYLSEQNTHVVSVHPGPIATDMAMENDIMENAEPPEVVAQAIIDALKNRDFFVFPDQIAQRLGRAYQGFFHEVVLPVLKKED